jgi:hypothetical protein
MEREVRFADAGEVLGELEYPIDRDNAAAAVSDVKLVLADGERNLGALVSETGTDSFDSVDDLLSELHNTLPRGAVGEPYQSEGEG